MSRQLDSAQLRDLLRIPLRGDPLIISTLERFRIKVRISNSGCWIWVGCINDKKSQFPYGRFRFRGEMYYAHRVSFFLFRGVLRRDKEILHAPTCESEACVNPQHLKQSSHATNMRKEWRRRYYGNPKPVYDPLPLLTV